jgi:hypothetical protein
MICPHCAATVRYRERAHHLCSRCQREFVFEPREFLTKVTDVRVRRAAERLGEGGRYRYTFGQLGAAVGRGGSAPPNFRETMLLRWAAVHGSLPAGLVNELGTIDAAPPTRPVVAHVVCPDRDVAACLLANDVQREFGVLVRARRPPPGTQPVLLFDDVTGRAAQARLATLRGSGRRAVAVGPSTDQIGLVWIRPSVLVEWLGLAVRAETRLGAGAHRAATVDFLDWPRATGI